MMAGRFMLACLNDLMFICLNVHMTMSKSRIFLFLLLSFIGGVFARSFFQVDNFFILLLIIISIIILTVFYKNPMAAAVAFMLLSFSVGIWKTDNILQKINNAELNRKNFQGEAIVLKNSNSTFGQNLIIEVDSMEKENAKVRMLLQVPPYPNFQYGNILKVDCTARIIENKDDAEFDYRMYMAKDSVLYSCENKKFEKISESGGNKVMIYILKLRDKFDDNISRLIPMPEGALASGILLGGSKGLSKEIQNDFSRTGMTHIVAVSGYNVTIIAEYLILIGIFLGLWRKQAIWFALFGIAIFVVMIGMPASAVRAGVMSSILLWAIKNGRLSSSENAIILAGAIMLFINPLLLRWDIGFQLSFMATLGIVLASPLWEKSFIKKHKALGMSEIIALSLSAQIFVWPIVAYNFHSVSLISLLVNVLVLPIVPISMLLVFLVSIFEIIFSPLAIVFAWISYVSLYCEIFIIHLLSQFPWASANVNNFSGWWMAVYYIILMLFIILFKNPNFKLPISNKAQNQKD